MEKEFLIVLFRNKTKKKILKKYKTLNRAKQFYQKLIDRSNNILFNKEWENAKPCNYELSLITNESLDNNIYISDELGRIIKVQLDDENYKIIKLNKLKVEEMIYDLTLKKKISFNFFIKNYVDNTSIKVIFSLNNKIVVQKEDIFNFFSLKNPDDAKRLVDTLSSYLVDQNRSDVILSKDFDASQRSYLYQLLKEKGFRKDFLYRSKTTYSHRFSKK